MNRSDNRLLGRIRRLNRRQRKKQRVGEFQELGFSLSWVFQPSICEADKDIFLDGFVSTIEARGLVCGGMISSEGGDLFVTKLGRGTVSLGDRIALIDWLQDKPHIQNVDAGSLADAWYGHTLSCEDATARADREMLS